MKKLFLTFGLCMAVSVAFGQRRAVADALRLAKDPKPNFAEARTKIKAALEHAETKDDAKTWYTAGEIEDVVVNGEITKQIYGKQQDDVVMYTALENLYPYFMKAYELDNLPDEKGKVKPKYTKHMQSILKADLPYFMNGGIYYFDKQDYKKGYFFFNAYVELSDSKLMKDGVKVEANAPIDSNYIYANYYAALATTQIGDHNIAVAALKRASEQEYERNQIIQLLAEEYKNVADTATWEAVLSKGLSLFPKESYFLVNLFNIYIQTGRDELAIQNIKRAIETDPTNAQLYDIAGRVYESNFKDMEKAEEYFKKSIEYDDANYETQSNLGRIYFNLGVNQLNIANDIQDVKKYNEEKAKANELFDKARPYFEKSFQLKPDLMETKIALRNIYYNLNMGDKFAEMEKLMGE